MKYIDYETKSLQFKEAAEKNLFQNCFVINGNKIFISKVTLEKELPKILHEIGVSLS